MASAVQDLAAQTPGKESIAIEAFARALRMVRGEREACVVVEGEGWCSVGVEGEGMWYGGGGRGYVVWRWRGRVMWYGGGGGGVCGMGVEGEGCVV